MFSANTALEKFQTSGILKLERAISPIHHQSSCVYQLQQAVSEYFHQKCHKFQKQDYTSIQ